MGFFDRPTIQQTPNLEPPGFDMMRALLMQRAMSMFSNPYGLNPQFMQSGGFSPGADQGSLYQALLGMTRPTFNPYSQGSPSSGANSRAMGSTHYDATPVGPPLPAAPPYQGPGPSLGPYRPPSYGPQQPYVQRPTAGPSWQSNLMGTATGQGGNAFYPGNPMHFFGGWPPPQYGMPPPPVGGSRPSPMTPPMRTQPMQSAPGFTAPRMQPSPIAAPISRPGGTVNPMYDG